jgi:hypothetical protein
LPTYLEYERIISVDCSKLQTGLENSVTWTVNTTDYQGNRISCPPSRRVKKSYGDSLCNKWIGSRVFLLVTWLRVIPPKVLNYLFYSASVYPLYTMRINLENFTDKRHACGSLDPVFYVQTRLREPIIPC